MSYQLKHPKEKIAMTCRHLSQPQSEALALNSFSSKMYDVYASMAEPSAELF